MSEAVSADEDKLKEVGIIDEIADGFTGVSLLSRLEFVANIMCRHADSEDDPSNASTPLRVGHKVLCDAVDLLRGYPQASAIHEPV